MQKVALRGSFHIHPESASGALSTPNSARLKPPVLSTSRKASEHPISPTLLTGQKSDRLPTPGALIPTLPISPSFLSSHLPTRRDEAGGHAWGPAAGGTHSPGGSWKLAGSWMVAVGGPLGTTSGRGPPAAAARIAGGPAEGAEGAGQPDTLAAGLPHAGAGPPAGEPAGGCSGCPPGISLTGAAAAAGALMEKEKARGAAGSRRAPRIAQRSGAAPSGGTPPSTHGHPAAYCSAAPRGPGLPRRREGERAGGGRARTAGSSYCGGAQPSPAPSLSGPAPGRRPPCL